MTLRITFLHGRYHATPWGRAVNEGRAEWPPSPWRVARALTSAWFQGPDDVTEEEFVRAIRLLAGTPTFALPPSGRGHARHYFTSPKIKTRKTGALVSELGLDPFVSVHPRHPLFVTFEGEVESQDVDVLATLCARVPYLGRAESVADLSVVEDPEQPGARWTTITPRMGDDDAVGDSEQLLAPTSSVTLEQLTVRTRDLHRDRRLIPPGTASWVVPYEEPTGGATQMSVPPRRDRPTTAILAITGRPNPSLHEAVLVADQTRARLTPRGGGSPILSGHDEDGSSLTGHGHAHYLALPGSSSTRIEQVVIFTPDGLGPDEVAVIAGLRDLVQPANEGEPYQQIYVRDQLGSQVHATLVHLGGAVQEHPLFATTRIWTSVTPVVTSRHRKARQSRGAFLEDVVRRHLDHRGFPSGDEEVDVAVDLGAATAFRRHRAPAHPRASVKPRSGGQVTLTFTQEQTGPILLGALAHFGLGTFLPA